MKSTFFASAAMVTLATAQYAINPDTVDDSQKRQWCIQQETSCPLICLQEDGNDASTRSNTCTPSDLTYSCVCSNGISPNISEYSQTLPYFICSEWTNQCVANCNGDNSCQSDCRENHPCGAQNPTRVTLSESATGSPTPLGSNAPDSTIQADASATGGAIYTGFGDTASETEDSGSSSSARQSDSPDEPEQQDDESSAARTAVLGFGSSFGLVTVVGGLFAGFALIL
ncbi:hypothetical protein MBLNU230_g4683t1 [Neophaeotheca triangularis]